MRALPADPPLALATVPGPRRPRGWRRLGLLAAVLGLHGVMVDHLLSGRVPTGAAGVRATGPRLATAVQVRTLAAPAAAVLVLPGPPALASQALRPAPATAVDRPARTVTPAAGPTRDTRGTREARAAAPSDALTDTDTVTDARPMASIAGAAAGEAAPQRPAMAAAAGEPPPVYATRLPEPTLLRYQWRQGLRSGDALLSWQHDGQRYRLQFDARLGADPPAVEQLSLGGFDAAGLAPQRFTDRRHGRSAQAANFRRDIGRISFSGPPVDYPSWPGAQDRLSWLVQLVAIQAAALAPLPMIEVFVVDAWGGGELWRFQPLGEAIVDTPLGRQGTRGWQREPERPEGQRVELWLDPARGHWPVQVRFTLLRSGEVSEWRLAAEPVAPP